MAQLISSTSMQGSLRERETIEEEQPKVGTALVRPVRKKRTVNLPITQEQRSKTTWSSTRVGAAKAKFGLSTTVMEESTMRKGSTIDDILG